MKRKREESNQAQSVQPFKRQKREDKYSGKDPFNGFNILVNESLNNIPLLKGTIESLVHSTNALDVFKHLYQQHHQIIRDIFQGHEYYLLFLFEQYGKHSLITYCCEQNLIPTYKIFNNIDVDEIRDNLSNINPITISVSYEQSDDLLNITLLRQQIKNWLQNNNNWRNVIFCGEEAQDDETTFMFFQMEMVINKHQTIDQNNEVFRNMKSHLETFHGVRGVYLNDSPVKQFREYLDEPLEDWVLLLIPLKYPYRVSRSDYDRNRSQLCQKMFQYLSNLTSIMKDVRVLYEGGLYCDVYAFDLSLKKNFSANNSIDVIEKELKDLKALIIECANHFSICQNYKNISKLSSEQKPLLFYGFFRQSIGSDQTLPKPVEEKIESFVCK